MARGDVSDSKRAYRRKRVLLGASSQQLWLARKFDSRQPEDLPVIFAGLPRDVRKSLRVSLRPNFGIAEILLIIQIMSVLWQLWSWRRKSEPNFIAATNQTLETHLAEIYDEIDPEIE